MVEWQLFPKSRQASSFLVQIPEIFNASFAKITSEYNNLSSNEVLAELSTRLTALGFEVESGKKVDQKISVPVLFGKNGTILKSFEADAFHQKEGIVLEVEAGRAVDNNQFLKDLFQACMMQEVNTLCIAVRKDYRKNDDFKKVCNFFETLYASDRLSLPLTEILIIGY
ncbi:MAG: hypothetical protein KF836_08045 [Fimbriimonadaceae bacterium]|nr:hypothetical protein [Fimbriimonadaceae bacterium]